MTINLPLIALIAVLLIIFILFLIIRNRKDEKDFEKKLNQDYKKPKRIKKRLELEDDNSL
jgi:hypothetical protein